jgi:hypothetical protein
MEKMLMQMQLVGHLVGMADIFDEIIVHRGRNHPMAAMHNAAHN